MWDAVDHLHRERRVVQHVMVGRAEQYPIGAIGLAVVRVSSMAISSEDLDRLQRLSDACGPASWVSLVEGRDIESGSSFIQVNEGRGLIGDIELTLVPGQGSPFELHRVGHEIRAQYQDLIAAACTNLPAMIAEVRRLQEEAERYNSAAH